MPPGKFEPQRFEWHPLLQAVPIPSLKLTSSTGLAIQHTREGTRGKDPAGSLEGRTVIATFGGSTTYDIGAGEGETWPDRLAEALGDRYFVVNHGVPGYTTAEHLIQTAFYQTKFGKPPRCAIYYVGWNDLRNAHIAEPRSRLCRFPSAEPDRFAEGAPRRWRPCHLLAAAHAADALRRPPTSTPRATSPILMASRR